MALLAAMVVLHLADTFSDVNETVTEGVDRLAQLGSIGIFLIALVANVSILIQIPYTLPLLSAAFERGESHDACWCSGSRPGSARASARCSPTRSPTRW